MAQFRAPLASENVGNVILASATFGSGTFEVHPDNSLAAIFNSIGTNAPARVNFLQRFRNGSWDNDAASDANQFPAFTPPLAAGQTVRLLAALTAFGDSDTPRLTLFLYRPAGDTTDDDLHGAISLRASDHSDLQSGEFYLNQNYQPTTTTHTLNIGYVAPDCSAANVTLSGNGLSCESTAVTPDPDPDPAPNDPAETTGGDETPPAPKKSNGGVGAPGIFIFVAGMFALYNSGGDANAFHFSPDVGYDITESGYAYNVGGRIDFRKDRWNLYWTAGQGNTNGDFGELRYAVNGEYRTDFWTAAFSESVQGETADYDFSLSADFRGGIWKVSPEFAVDSRYENGEFATTNSFRISGEMQYDDWRFSVSGDTERMHLSAVHWF